MALKPSSIQKRRAYQLGSYLIGGKVGEDDPGFFLFGVPDHQQSAAAFGLGSAEGGAAANPGRIGTGNEALGGQSFAAVAQKVMFLR